MAKDSPYPFRRSPSPFSEKKGLETPSLPSLLYGNDSEGTLNLSSIDFSHYSADTIALDGWYANDDVVTSSARITPMELNDDLRGLILPSSTPEPPYQPPTSSPRKKQFSCPWFEAETAQGLPHSCNGPISSNMADIRRHMTRGRRPHVSFLQLCPTCNETFMNKDLFESAHGYAGEYCNINRKQHRGEAVEAQWHQLYGMIFDKVNKGEGASSSDKNTPLTQPPSLPPLDSLSGQVPVPEAISQPPELRPREYTHPYELHMDLDSDDAGKGILAWSQPVQVNSEYQSGLYNSENNIESRGFPAPQYSLTVPSTSIQTSEFVSSTKSTTSSDSSVCAGPVECEICGSVFSGEYRRGNLSRHIRQKHGNIEQVYPCEEVGCGRVFKRQDARLKHHRRCHPNLLSEPIIPRPHYGGYRA